MHLRHSYSIFVFNLMFYKIYAYRCLGCDQKYAFANTRHRTDTLNQLSVT